MARKLVASSVLLAVILTSPVVCAEASPAKILIMGFPQHIQLVAKWLEADPMVDARQVPARAHLTTLQESEIRRFVRIYFPRTYADLIEHEYLMLLVVEIFQFTPEQQVMIYDAIVEAGSGAVQDRSVMSTGGWISIPWADSIVSDAFPNDAERVVSQNYCFSKMTLRYAINENPGVAPVLSPYSKLEGVEATIFHPHWTCIAIPRQGAVVTSYIVGAFSQGFGGTYPDPGFRSPGWMPHTMYWEHGNATTWTHHDSVGQDLYWDPARNLFSVDMLLAEFLFSTGRKLPEDVLLVHGLRTRFASLSAEKGFVYSVLEWAEKFGASGTPVVSKMKTIDETASVGKSAYLAQAYDESLAAMREALSAIESLRSEAMRLKDRALLCVHFTEWLAVSGVTMLSALLLWSLMVRRRLYREVVVTRLR